MTANYNYSTSSPVNTVQYEEKYSGSVAIGAKGVVGAELTQGKFIFYAQISMITMSYAPSKRRDYKIHIKWPGSTWQHVR